MLVDELKVFFFILLMVFTLIFHFIYSVVVIFIKHYNKHYMFGYTPKSFMKGKNYEDINEICNSKKKS